MSIRIRGTGSAVPQTKITNLDLESLVDTLRGPMLVVCIARSELLAQRDGWSRHGGGRHALVELAPLSDIDAAAVMHDLLSPCGEVAEVDPLVEEAVELVLQAGAVGGAGEALVLDMGAQVRIADVAKVHPAPMIRAGLVTRDGQGEVVTGLVMMLIGENSREVVGRVKEEIARLQKSLPPH